MKEILYSIILFCSILILLTLLILWFKRWLMPKGNVHVRVNHERDLLVPVGSRLLASLADADIFVPSACGGGGTCGQCRVKLLHGGRPLLPTEASLINKKEAKEGFRLACQFTVTGDLSIQVPDDVFGVKQWTCSVRSNVNVATFIKELVLDLPEGQTIDFRAGGYIQIECPAHELSYASFDIQDTYRADWQKLGLFKLSSTVRESTVRAYSLANFPLENTIIMLNIRIATPPPSAHDTVPPGVMSSWLFNLKAADKVNVSGPYGEFFAREGDAEMVFIGGGAGMAPMRSHIFDQLKRIHTERKISFWYGARSLREVFYAQQFDQLAASHANFSWHLALSEPLPEDHWTGLTGFLHDVLYEQYLQNHSAPEDCEYYLCGPPMMVAAVTRLLNDLGVEKENVLFDDFGN